MDRTGRPDALLFDVGGVVIDIDFQRAIRAWQSISSLSREELNAAFRCDQEYERHERGEISASSYFDHLASSLGLRGTHALIADAWNSIHVGEITETLRMVQAARSQLPCFAFTNTNATHHAAWSSRFPAVVASFDRIFASYQLGCRKPEQRAFELVAREIGASLDAIVFFDDSAENVEAAHRIGMRAVLVRSPDDIRTALESMDITL